jgi:hypothetical protein
MNHRHLFGFAIGMLGLGMLTLLSGLPFYFNERVLAIEFSQHALLFVCVGVLASFCGKVAKAQAYRIDTLEHKLAERSESTVRKV